MWGEWTFVLAQALGLINTGVSLVMMQFKNARTILIFQIMSTLLISGNFLLLGGLSGAWICIVGAVQSAAMYFFDCYCKKDVEKKRKILLVFFLAAYITGTIVVYKSWHDIVSGICAVLFVFSIVQKEARHMRSFSLANCCCWLLYAVFTLAYTIILTHIAINISILVAKYRLDRKVSKV